MWLTAPNSRRSSTVSRGEPKRGRSRANAFRRVLSGSSAGFLDWYRQAVRLRPTRPHARRWLRPSCCISPTASRFCSGVSTFFQHPLQGLDIECLISDQALEPSILLRWSTAHFEQGRVPAQFEALGFRDRHTCVLATPPIESSFADAVFTAQIGRFATGLVFLE